jgi:hypothetical protein
MVFLPTHRRQPKPWAAYATAAIVLHGLAIALLVNGATNGPQGQPMDIELVELVPDNSDPFAAPLDSPPPSEQPAPVDPGPILPPVDRSVPADSVLLEQPRPDPIQSDPIQSNPIQSNPIQSDPIQTTPSQPDPVQTAPSQPAPTATSPTQSLPPPVNSETTTTSPPIAPTATPSFEPSSAPTQNPADIPQGQVNVPSQNQGIGLNVGLAIARYGASDIPLVRRATPKETSQQFVLDPSQFACTSLVTPEASRDLGQPVTLALAIDAQGQVTDITTRAADFLSPDYLALAQCIVKQWAFDPAIDQTEQGETIPRPDNATVTLTLQNQSL